MSVIDPNAIQVGGNATELNNLVIVPDGSGSVSIQQGVIGGGSNRTVMTIDSAGHIETPLSGSTLMTAQATTSGTSIDFTGIPSWAKQITVMLNGVSTNGTSNLQIQIGDAGGVENTGYFSTSTSAAAGVREGHFSIPFRVSNALY